MSDAHSSFVKPFIAHLYRLAGISEGAASQAREMDRAALAALRRGLGKPPGTVIEMYPYVFRDLPSDIPQWQVDAAFLLAALFASYHSPPPAQPAPPADSPSAARPSNLGASFRTLARKMGDQGSEGAERRFQALLAADRDTLPSHLRHAISLLRAHEVPVDWGVLMSDLLSWDHPGRLVQRRWSRTFWAPDPATAATPEPAQPAEAS